MIERTLHPFNRLSRISSALASFISVLLCAAVPAVAMPDVLDRPAPTGIALERTVLTAIAPAGKRFIAVGERGTIVLSDDDGKSWRHAKNVPVSVTLTNVHFPTPTAGWAVGHLGVILHSTDGGSTWVRQFDGVRAASSLLDAANKTNNPGEIANARLFVKDGPNKPFLKVLFQNERHGLVLGAYGLIFYTDDGGATWQPWLDRLENPGGLHLYDISIGETETYIAGEQGLLLHSANGFQHFSPMPTPYDGSYFGLLRISEQELIIYGLRGNALRSDDAGENWTKVLPGETDSITSGIILRDGRIILVDQGGQLLVSHDRGRSFIVVKLEDVWPFSDLVEAADGGLILVGSHGVKRLTTQDLEASLSTDKNK